MGHSNNKPLFSRPTQETIKDWRATVAVVIQGKYGEIAVQIFNQQALEAFNLNYAELGDEVAVGVTNRALAQLEQTL